MQKFLSTINGVKKINKAKKMISDESKKTIINTNEEKHEEEKHEEEKTIINTNEEKHEEEKYKYPITKETLERRIFNLQMRMKILDIENILSEVKEFEEYLKNKEEIIKMYGDEYKEKIDRLEKLIKQAYKKEEQKKEKKRKLDLRGYENELIEKLKYKKSEDNENGEALKEIDRYIISTYRTYITENERAKEDREKIECGESKKCIRGYYGLQNNECCEGHRNFLNWHFSIKQNVEEEIRRTLLKEKKYNIELFDEVECEPEEIEEVENNIIEDVEDVEKIEEVKEVENIEEVKENTCIEKNRKTRKY